jgi:hypothetical protein
MNKIKNFDPEETENSVEEVKVPVIGEFKPKRKFLTFVSAIAGKKVRFLRDSATIKGEKLSGMLEGVTFKITICDEGTINFDEVDTNKTDKAMRQRLINDIDDIQTSGYANKFIVSGLEFTDVDGSRCYLEVEHTTPFDKLKSIFDTDEVEEVEEVVLSEKGLSILDQLFGSDEDDDKVANVLFTSENDEELARELEGESDEEIEEDYMAKQFRLMNEAKVIELKQRIEDSERDILKYKKESKMALKNADELSDKLSVLQTRLETLSVGDEPNGWAFFVSDIQKNETGLDESTKAVADKIADLMKLKKDVLFEHLTASYYKISIAEKSNFDNKKPSTDLLEKINTLDIDGKISMTSDGEFEYRGKLNWHQLTAKMIRKGFEQVPDFDKVAGSNSYEVKTEKEVVLEEKSSEASEFKQQTLMTFDKPTTIVLLGDGTNDCDNSDFQVTDDESGFDIYVGGKPSKYSSSCTGFGSVVTLEEYKNWKYNLEYDGDISDAYIITGFTGTIGISAKLEDDSYSTDFDLDDYICHQFDGYVDVIINLPEGTELHKIEDHDLSKVTSLLRDDKINTILE